MKNSVFMLWLVNVDPELFSAVPSLRQVAAEGIDLHLAPQALHEKRACTYQTLSGMSPGKFGYFDAVKPVAYHVHYDDDLPEGILGRLLPDILRQRGLQAVYVEVQNQDELDVVARQMQECSIVRIPAANDAAAIESLVQRCMQLLAPHVHLLVLTDVWQEPAARFVNVNNFLADHGVLEVGIPRTRETINWSETLAYYLGSGQLWINLHGREPQGIVVPGREYQQVCEALLQALSLWQDPDSGEAIVKRVVHKEMIYSGEYLFMAPDMIIEYQPGYTASPQAESLDFDMAAVYRTGKSTTRQERTVYARLVARGPNLVRGQWERGWLVDVLPNVLYLLGQPAPAHIDGKIMPSLFTPSHRSQYPKERLAKNEFELTNEEQGQIEDRLRALGYLE